MHLLTISKSQGFFKLVLISILLSKSTYGCNNTIDDYSCSHPIPQEIEKLLSSAKHLNEIITAEDTIQLETIHGGLIGSINKVLKHPNGYLILDARSAKQVFLFDENGSFIKLLGRSGKGPREYKLPNDISIDQNGYSYILDSSLGKILKFDDEGNFAEEIFFRELGILPLEFRVMNSDSLFLFYNIEGNFYGKSEMKKIIVTQKKNDRLNYLYAFGEPEPLLQKLQFNLGSFEVIEDRVWIGRIFDLEAEIYSLEGDLLKRINQTYQKLPGPHISEEKLKNFSRPSKALNSLYKLTRFYKHVFLKNIVLSIYFAGKKTIILFFDLCGNLLKYSIHENKYPIPGSIVVPGITNSMLPFQRRQKVSLMKMK